MSAISSHHNPASSTAMEHTQYCTFWLRDMYFGIDVHHVQEVLRPQEMTNVPLVCGHIGGLINLRGQIVTAVDLRARLGLPANESGEPPMNIVVHADGDVVSLLVDRIGEVLDVDITAFEPPPPTLGGPYREVIRSVNRLDNELLCLFDTASALNFSALTGSSN